MIKYFLILLMLLSLETSAQKLDIILVGVSHNYSNYQQQDFSGIYRKIKEFNPDAFFGEFLSREDEKNLMDYWCKKDNLNRLNILKKNRDIPLSELPGTIERLKKSVAQSPKNYRLRADLAHAYYLDQDVSNAHYQYWHVLEGLKKIPDTSLEKYVETLLSPKLDTTGRSMRRLKTSEYALIAFPAMRELGISELLPMDCQDYDLNWNASWAESDKKFNEFRKDTSKVFQSDLKKIIIQINKGFARYDSIEKSSKHVTEWLNTSEASTISASGDFYLPVMYDMKNFPKEEMSSKIHWWLMRNRGMCENVVTRSRSRGIKKVVVFAGANHRKFMQEIFEKLPGVSVKNINEVN